MINRRTFGATLAGFLALPYLPKAKEPGPYYCESTMFQYHVLVNNQEFAHWKCGKGDIIIKYENKWK